MNVAATVLLLRGMRGHGGFGGGEGSDYTQAQERYKIPEAYNAAYRIDGTSILTAYLDGRCKMTAFGASNAHNIFNDTLTERNLREQIPAYREYAQSQVNMITPPSFMEKVMLLRRTLKEQRAGRILNVSTLGLTALGTGMISLAARAYGRAKGHVLEKALGREKRQGFSERLADLKSRQDFKRDLKKLDKLAAVRAQAVENSSYAAQTYYAEGTSRHRVFTTSELLNAYLFGRRDIDEKGVSNVASDVYVRETSVSLQEVDRTLAKTAERIDMIEPPSRAEKILMRAEKWLEERRQYHSVDSSLTAAASALIGKMTQKYICRKEAENPDFKGKLSMYSRFSDIRLRGQYEQDAVKLKALRNKMATR